MNFKDLQAITEVLKNNPARTPKQDEYRTQLIIEFTKVLPNLSVKFNKKRFIKEVTVPKSKQLYKKKKRKVRVREVEERKRFLWF